MQSVLISVKPKWCELIANGEKTIEVRKTRPKIEPPFKCYIYCTSEKYKGRYLHTSNLKGRLLFWENPNDCFISIQPENYIYKAYSCKGKVIGEFICNGIIRNCEMANADIAEKQGKIKREELLKYSCGKELYGWHISSIKIYNKPKELNDFVKECCSYFNLATSNCTCLELCCYQFRERGFDGWESIVCADQEMCIKRVTHPPQSWCYVESL